MSKTERESNIDSNDDEASQSIEQMTTLYDEINAIVEDDTIVEEEADFSTETKVRISGSNKNKALNGLLDSGASGTHIKRSAPKNVKYVSKQVNVKVSGRYATSQIKQMAVFECRLPDF